MKSDFYPAPIRLQIWRAAHEVTQADLAAEFDFQGPAVAGWEKTGQGRLRAPALSTAAGLQAMSGIPAADWVVDA